MVALAPADLHGYGIMQEVARLSEGCYKLGPGTLYDNLQKLLDQGLVEEAPPREGAGEDPRRRNYRLTKLGRTVISAELSRLESLVRHARIHLRPQVPGRNA